MAEPSETAEIVKDCAGCNGTGEGVYVGKDWTGPSEKPCEYCNGTGKDRRHQLLVDEFASTAKQEERTRIVAKLREKQAECERQQQEHACDGPKYARAKWNAEHFRAAADFIESELT